MLGSETIVFPEPVKKLLDTDGLLAQIVNQLKVVNMSLGPLQFDDEPRTLEDLDIGEEILE